MTRKCLALLRAIVVQRMEICKLCLRKMIDARYEYAMQTYRILLIEMNDETSFLLSEWNFQAYNYEKEKPIPDIFIADLKEDSSQKAFVCFF